MNFKKTLLIAAMAITPFITTGCIERIATGEVGIRVNASKEIQGAELMPGSWKSVQYKDNFRILNYSVVKYVKENTNEI